QRLPPRGPLDRTGAADVISSVHGVDAAARRAGSAWPADRVERRTASGSPAAAGDGLLPERKAGPDPGLPGALHLLVVVALAVLPDDTARGLSPGPHLL